MVTSHWLPWMVFAFGWAYAVRLPLGDRTSLVRSNTMEQEQSEQKNGDAVTGGVRSTKAVKLRVTDIDWLQDEAGEDESPAAVLTRLRGELLMARKHLIEFAATIKEDLKELDDLRSGSQITAIDSPGQTGLGDFGGEVIRDTMDSIKDVCDDETVCVKTALHLIDKKSDIVEKQLDRDHVLSEKEKDRKFKADLEASKAEHQRKLALIKKGVVDRSDLEDVVFLGSVDRGKTAGERLAYRKKQTYDAASGADDEDFEMVDDGELGYGGSPEDDDE